MIWFLILVQLALACLVVWCIFRRIKINPYEAWAPAVGGAAFGLGCLPFIGLVANIAFLLFMYLFPAEPRKP